jgi:hypothetical protein
MSAASDIARSHVAAFNQAVASGDFADFLARFDDAAIIRFENVPSAGALEFAGRAAYTAAYAQQAPDDQIDIAGQPGEDRGAVVIPFAWRRDGARGTMRLDRQDGRIMRMTVTFA